MHRPCAKAGRLHAPVTMKITRRDALAASASVALSGAACTSSRAAAAPPVVQPSSFLRPSTNLVAVVRPSQHQSLAEAVRAVIAAAGGLGFIRDGQTVLLKPAANSAQRYPATTDPEVLLEVAKAVQERGGRPFIADRTMFRASTNETFDKLGYFEVAAQAGIACRPLDDEPVVGLQHSDAVHWGGVVPIYAAVAAADHVINLCTPRTHQLGDFTMAQKNWVGVVDSSARLGMHFPSGFKQRLAELSLVLRPSLVLMDGRKGFTDGGPDSGDVASFDFLAAGTDPLAIDAVGLANLRISGTNARIADRSIWALPVMARAAQLRPAGVRRVRITGLSVGEAARWLKELA